MTRQLVGNLDELCWPSSRLDEAVEWLVRSHGLGSSPPTPRASMEAADLDSDHILVESAAARFGVEAEPVTCLFNRLDGFFRSAAPAIIPMPEVSHDGAAPGYLILCRSGRTCQLLDPEQRLVRVSSKVLTALFRSPISSEYNKPANDLLELAGIRLESRGRVANALIESWLGGEVINAGWMLRPSPGASLFVQARNSRIFPRLFGWLGMYVVQNVIFILAWWLIGRVVLDGQTDRGWVWAWALLLLSALPFQIIGAYLQNKFSEAFSIIFKQRLLYGALKMNPDEIRHLGSGQMLERVMEAESFEVFALGGGLTALLAMIQLGIAAFILFQGEGGLLSVALLIIWLTAILVAGLVNYRSGRQWTDTYREMTNGLVEKMVGHRTRLAQEDPQRRHEEEDAELEQYETLTHHFSRMGSLLNAIPSSWLVAGIAGLVPTILSASSVELPKFALSLGGIMLAHQTFGMIQAGIQNAIMLLLSWDQVKPVYKAASEPVAAPGVIPKDHSPLTTDGAVSPEPLLLARELTYRYPLSQRAVLQYCNLEVFEGDHIILEGASGGGKTTLGALLAGLRRQETGLLLLRGYDRNSLGEEVWRRRVVMAPQFHENHIFNETFAFNLLMGRRWPPEAEDMVAAGEICEELGLSDLLARMPSGWQQLVGENGWQLSHGERSRVFIARALLQKADMVIMDESFGALDPENLYFALDCARRRAATLLVIAHP